MPIDYAAHQKMKNTCKAAITQCPACGVNNWAISDDLVSPLHIDLE